ncbi:MAG: hypothetical protein ACRENE_14620 [Polyangiaceae bacterium]
MPKKTDFYRLPRPVQDRFAAATRRAAPPAPLLFEPAPRTRVWAFLGAGGGLTLFAIVLLEVGWGNVASALSIHKAGMLGVDAFLFAAAAYCVLHAVAILRTMESMPWRPGMYLFPANVVDARAPMLHVWAVADSEGVERVTSPHPGLALRMRDGSRVVVGAAGAAEVERADTTLAARRGELAQAIAEENPHLLAELDPLHDSALSSPIGPSEAMKRTTPTWVRLDWACAAALGVLLGLIVGDLRNAMSDAAMYRDIAGGGTIAQLKEYLSRGGKHSDEVSDVMLPRAELKEAQAAGTVAAIKDFGKAHPGSKIQPEIDAALRQAMLVDLEKAKAAGTVSALDAFAKANPDKLVDRELAAARHALYVKAFAAWSEKAQVDAPTRAFVQRLVTWVEKNGPACDVRFRLQPSKSMDDADKSVVKSGHYPGPDAKPSKYTTPEMLHPREDQVAKDVAQAFADAFPPDILSMQPRETLAGDAPPTANVPVLLIEYSPEWTRANTACTRPPTVFAGLAFTFETAFSLPDGSPPVKLSTRAWRGAELWKIKATDAMSREDYEKAVYDAMLDGAFTYLAKKEKDFFF